jgi:uncharacterized protein (DUF488 family)
MPGVVSVGYEAVDLDEFVQDLLRQRVNILVDIRLNALSRRPGFSKSALAEALGGAGPFVRFALGGGWGVAGVLAGVLLGDVVLPVLGVGVGDGLGA